MDYITQTLFGTPLIKFNNIHSYSEEEMNYIKSLELLDQKDSASISKDKFILERDELKRVRDAIDRCAEKYIENFIQVNNEFERTNSWLAVAEQEHEKHNHKCTIFSVVHYVEADNATITFYQNKNFITRSYDFDLDYIGFNEFNARETTIPVKTGDVIIFPGDVEHSSQNFSDKKKYVIGANYFIRGDVGDQLKVTSLRL
jgi:hypothetical protein